MVGGVNDDSLYATGEGGEDLFAVASFRNVPDATQKRGARQFALVLDRQLINCRNS